MLTTETMQAISYYFDEISFDGDYDSEALRKALSKIVVEKIVTLMQEHSNKSETEPEVLARLRVSTRVRSIELLTRTRR
jgi:hypothetical protein